MGWRNEQWEVAMAASVGKAQRRVVAIVAGCLSMVAAGEAGGQGVPSPPGLANPASVRCVEIGGTVRLERLPDGSQYGVCIFIDNRQCEEWALFRGDCPAGGLRVTGYITPAARYCAITGGRYSVTAASGTADEQGTCTLPGGKICDAAAYFGATCSRERP
jgi:putative hemolysin